jgi:SEC-C motif-containing protein
MNCHCGNAASFEDSCGKYLQGSARPETAEALMRSRYTAYVVEDIDYIVATHDPATAGEIDREGAAKWAHDSEWEGLEIVDTVAGGAGDDRGEVEFIARYRAQGHLLSYHERATFERIDGQWYFMDGEMVKAKPKTREQPKVGRNEPCPCGSGKKYKKCHGA